MQPVDYTTLIASCSELRVKWLPARLEQVYQRDRFTITIALRTLKKRGWLDISWHPQGARICISDPPPRAPDTFTFSQQLRHQLGGLALIAIVEVSPWERVLDFQFAKRPGEAPLWHLYVEVMTKYSNVILTTADNFVVTCAHQVNSQQSSLRQIQTGQPYELPPSLTNPIPNLQETQQQWQERISLIPGVLWRNLIKNYRGLSKALVQPMIEASGLDSQESTNDLSASDWQKLFKSWQEWLKNLEHSKFYPGWTENGYTVTGWLSVESVDTVQELLNDYYTGQLNQQEFSQLYHQISQKLKNITAKLQLKADTFTERLHQSDGAELLRSQADLLMANLHEWRPGMKAITLCDFETGEPMVIKLDPEKNAVQNAQSLYKKHQKLKRARVAVEPLLATVQAEIDYLEQVEAFLSQLDTYQTPEDLRTLEEIRDELIQQAYLKAPEHHHQDNKKDTEFYRYETPGGFELLVGRNNRQNDLLTFRVAGDYDLWFHTQEIPGSHVLLRLDAGATPDEVDLQFVADISAFYSRARQSEIVPVIYTKPKFVYKPKGAKPGMVVYKQEQVFWGKPQRAETHIAQLIGIQN
ncbi:MULTISPECIES: NFACT family protein [Okeania]|uniref:Rqc2 homolog RqcH n=1 Tax=Okeania hirsuta TaxID=1458930 RepID=A0A3N6PL48_9CYAN|nr:MULTISPECIES: NFACT RNA binding domain-containing protein [Okeania]NES76479.1 fibronectin/fibrinogen-binding protein [Okeania sp. SIO1H4]NES90958.1 fibronectin/fibrinogen-binding protein [Okeania sp. SIO2B9]NET20344.1 fibronectin/fibrinogen-binding protein [Okeania sp. SIO1H5]NET77067.1 fibronectin/fibrinogen-binding protein [Okeania sp. SIO1F9]NET95613.1 fibronectin/fibrinogen-binding protein [Okeania sp. SIO1H2]